MKRRLARRMDQASQGPSQRLVQNKRLIHITKAYGVGSAASWQCIGAVRVDPRCPKTVQSRSSAPVAGPGPVGMLMTRSLGLNDKVKAKRGRDVEIRIDAMDVVEPP